MRKIRTIVPAVALFVLMFSAGRLSATFNGPLDAPTAPNATSSYNLQDIYNRLNSGAAGTQHTFVEPSSGPTSGTMHSLNDIMAKAPAADNTNGATAAQVVSGKKFFGLNVAEWGLQTGTAAVRGNVSGANGARTISIPDGFYSGSKTATANDSALVAGNIKSGVTIFGVAGDSNVVNTGSGDAVAADIQSGKKAWVDGSEITGTAVIASGNAAPADVLSGKTFSTSGNSGLTGAMPDNGALTITPGTSNQAIAEGYHNGSGTVYGDADLLSGNIKSGVTIFGVSGDTNVVDTSAGDALEGDIRSGKKAYVAGNPLTGSMPEGSDVSGADGQLTFGIPEGYYAGKTATANDANLTASNIITGVTIFGVPGSYSAREGAVPRTGQTDIWDAHTPTGDDGALELGVALPEPHFTINGDGTVTDNLTGLIWLQDANCPNASRTWQEALDDVRTLNSSGDMNGRACGAGNSHTDWRLPNIRELQSLVHYGYYNPVLPDTNGTAKWTTAGEPFTRFQISTYWSSTTWAGGSSQAWVVDFYEGMTTYAGKTGTRWVWPVRGGE